MGGTSTDVSHFDGTFERAFETEVAGVRMRAPMMNIHTVAAGGGSILHLRRPRRFRVGPDSAGARSRSRSLSSRRAADRDGRQRHGRQAPARALSRHLRPRPGPAARCRHRERRSSEMRSTRRTSVARAEAVADGLPRRRRREHGQCHQEDLGGKRGYDVTRYALRCFGGAGGQHACAVADRARHGTRPPPSALGRALGLWHGACRHPREPQPRPRTPAGRGRHRRRGRGHLGPRRRGVRGTGTAGLGRGRSRRPPCARISATPAPTARFLVRVTEPRDVAALRLSFETEHRGPLRFRRRRQAPRNRGGRGRGDRAAAARIEEPSTEAVPRDVVPELERRTRFYSGGHWYDAGVAMRRDLAPAVTASRGRPW